MTDRKVPVMRGARSELGFAQLVALLLCGAAAGVADHADAMESAAASTTVILVRHAEKELDGGDVPLSAAGEARAAELVEVVRGAGVTLAIASEFRRTQQTIAPAVEALALAADQVLEITEPAAVAAEILGNQRGDTVLVAGHSDTVPQIVEALGAPSLCPPFEVDPTHGCIIPDPEYHHLFVVVVPATGAATVVRARYGPPSGESPADLTAPGR